MSRIGWVVSGAIWFLLVFIVAFRLTFPSDAVGERIGYEVEQATDGAMRLELAEVAPWWIGASAERIRLFQIDPRSDESHLTFAADSAQARVGLWSLLRQKPTVSGEIRLGSGQVDFEVATQLDDVQSQLRLGEVELTARSLPLEEVAALAGATMTGTGHLDVDITLDAEGGMDQARGRAALRGRRLQIDELDLSEMGVPDLGLQIPVEELDLTLDIVSGKAQVVRGILRSELATVEVSGDIMLRDDLGRSVLNLQIAVGELGSSLQMFKSFLGTERDGRFHYTCTGQAQRANCRAESARGSARGGDRAVPAPRAQRPDREERGNIPRNMRVSPGSEREAPVRGGGDEAEREKRRAELRERLRARREGLVPGAVPVRMSGDAYDDDEEYDEDDEFVDEELLGDEEYLDDDFEDF